jgi:hypothetical protein
MTKRSMFRITLAVLSLLFFLNVGAAAQKTDCAKATDAEIVKAIYDKLKTKYDSQLIHINVRINKERLVTIEGWATTEKVKKDIKKLALKIKCVKDVDNQLTIGIGGGCGPGTKKCGAICIPLEETCNICTAKTCL